MTSLSRLSHPMKRAARVLSTVPLFLAARAFAQFGADLPDIQNTAEGDDVRGSVVQVINFILTFLALVAVIFVIIGGVRILVAGGNDEQVKKGRQTIIYAIIGLVIVFFARVIVGFFTNELAGIF